MKKLIHVTFLLINLLKFFFLLNLQSYHFLLFISHLLHILSIRFLIIKLYNSFRSYLYQSFNHRQHHSLIYQSIIFKNQSKVDCKFLELVLMYSLLFLLLFLYLVILHFLIHLSFHFLLILLYFIRFILLYFLHIQL